MRRKILKISAIAIAIAGILQCMAVTALIPDRVLNKDWLAKVTNACSSMKPRCQGVIVVKMTVRSV